MNKFPVSVGSTLWYVTTVIDCGELSPPTYGTVSVTSTTYTSVANYSCNTGYDLVGGNESVCLITGVWSAPQPQCRSKTHPDLNVVHTHIICHPHDT